MSYIALRYPLSQASLRHLAFGASTKRLVHWQLMHILALPLYMQIQDTSSFRSMHPEVSYVILPMSSTVA